VDFWDLTKLIFRRWMISLPLLLLTIGAGAATWVLVEPDYKATSYVQLIPPAVRPSNDPADRIVNPWLDLGLDNLSKAASFITTDSTFLQQLDLSGLSDAVTITDGYPNPVATFEVVGKNKQIAVTTSEMVLQRYIESVKRLQTDRGVQPENMIISVRLDAGNNLAETGGKVKRAFIAVVAVGLLLTLGVTTGLDALIRRRKRAKLHLDDIGPGTQSSRQLSVPRDIDAVRVPPVGIGRERATPRNISSDLVDQSSGGVRQRDSELESRARSDDEELTRAALLTSDNKPPRSDSTIILPLSVGTRRTDDSGGRR
jgi:hypothetical protein